MIVSAHERRASEDVRISLPHVTSPGLGAAAALTDGKIRVHVFCGALGISLLQSIHKQSQAVWPGLSMEQLLEELKQIEQFVLLYPTQGDEGPSRTATVLAKQSLPQQGLAEALGLDELRSALRG